MSAWINSKGVRFKALAVVLALTFFLRVIPAISDQYTLAPPNLSEPPCVVEWIDGKPSVRIPESVGRSYADTADIFIEHILARAVGDPGKMMGSSGVKNLIEQLFKQFPQGDHPPIYTIYDWRALSVEQGRILVPLTGQLKGKRRIFSGTRPAEVRQSIEFNYRQGDRIWIWEELENAEDETLLRAILKAAGHNELLGITRDSPEIAFLMCRQILENDLAVTDDDGYFTGFYNACIPDVESFRDDFPGVDVGKEAIRGHLRHLTRHNYARSDNIINYILSWTRDNMVNTWFYFLDWRFHRNEVSRERCATTYRALLDFYGSEEQRKKIENAIKRYSETGKRSRWDDPDVSVDPRLNPLTGKGIPADLDKSLQLDAIGLLLAMVGLTSQEGVLEVNDGDIDILNMITRKGGYLDSMEWEDFGIWEEGRNDKDRYGREQKHLAETHTSSIALIAIGLRQIRKAFPGEIDIAAENFTRSDAEIRYRLEELAEGRKFESDTRSICFGILFALVLDRMAGPDERIFSSRDEEIILRAVSALEDKEFQKGLIRYKGDGYNSWNDGISDREAPWPFGYGLLSLYHGLAALEEAPGKEHKKEAGRYLSLLNSTITERGIPESFNGDSPIVLNPLGYPMAALMASKLVLDRVDGRDFTPERQKHLEAAVDLRRSELFLEKISNMSPGRVLSKREITIPDLNEFVVLLDSPFRKERAMAREMLGRYISYLDTDGLVYFMRDIFQIPNLSERFAGRFELVRGMAVDHLAFILGAEVGQRGLQSRKETLKRAMLRNRDNPAFTSMITDSLMKAGRMRRTPLRAYLPGSIFYGLHMRHFTDSGTIKEAMLRLKELRDLGITDIVLAPPVFKKDLSSRKGPSTGHLAVTEQVKIRESDKRYGSLHSITDFTKVDPEFGDTQDLEEFIHLANAYGMRVYVDWVSLNVGPENINYSKDMRSGSAAWAFYWDVQGLAYDDPEKYNEILSINADLCAQTILMGFSGLRMDATCDVSLALYRGLTGMSYDWWEPTETVLSRVPEDHPSRTIWRRFKDLLRQNLAARLESMRQKAFEDTIIPDTRERYSVLIMRYTGRSIENALIRPVTEEEIILPNLLEEEQWHNRSLDPVESGTFDLIIGWPGYFNREDGRKGVRFAFSDGSCDLEAFFAYLEHEKERFSMPHQTLGKEIRFLRIGETHDQSGAADIVGGDSYISRFAKLVGKERLKAFYSFLWALGGPPFINTHQEFGDDRMLEQFAYVPYHLEIEGFSKDMWQHLRRLNMLKRISPDMQTADFTRVGFPDDVEARHRVAAIQKNDLMVAANLSFQDCRGVELDLSTLVNPGETGPWSVFDLISGESWTVENTEGLASFSIDLEVGESRYFKVSASGEEPWEIEVLRSIDNERAGDHVSLLEDLLDEVIGDDVPALMDLVMNSRDSEFAFISGSPSRTYGKISSEQEENGIVARRITELINSDDPVKTRRALEYLRHYLSMMPLRSAAILEEIARDNAAASRVLPGIGRAEWEVLLADPERTSSLDKGLAGFFRSDAAKDNPYTTSVEFVLRGDVPFEQFMVALPDTLAEIIYNGFRAGSRDHQFAYIARRNIISYLARMAESYRGKDTEIYSHGFVRRFLRSHFQEMSGLDEHPEGINEMIDAILVLTPARDLPVILDSLYFTFRNNAIILDQITLSILARADLDTYRIFSAPEYNRLFSAIRESVDRIFSSENVPSDSRDPFWFTSKIIDARIRVSDICLLSGDFAENIRNSISRAIESGELDVVRDIFTKITDPENVLFVTQNYLRVIPPDREEHVTVARETAERTSAYIKEFIKEILKNDARGYKGYEAYTFTREILNGGTSLFDLLRLDPQTALDLIDNAHGAEIKDSQDYMSRLASKTIGFDIVRSNNGRVLYSEEVWGDRVMGALREMVRRFFEEEREESRYRARFWFTRMVLNDNVSLHELVRIYPGAIDSLADSIRSIAFEQEEEQDLAVKVFDYSDQHSLSVDPDNLRCVYWNDEANISGARRIRSGNGTELAVFPPELSSDGVVFRVYAPDALRISVEGDFFKAIAKKSHDWGFDKGQFPMAKQENGFWSITIPLEPFGDDYYFRITLQDTQGEYTASPGGDDQLFRLRVEQEGDGERRPPDIPEWATKGLRVYELFPRFFNDFGEEENREAAIIQFAEHMKDEGFNAVWLMPTHPEGNAGRKGDPGSPYAVRDHFWFNIGNEWMDFLSGELEKRGIKLIFDVAANHTAPDHFLREIIGDDMWVSMDGQPIPPMSDWYDIIQLNHLKTGTQNFFLVYMAMLTARYGASGFRCDVGEFAPVTFWKRLFSTLQAFQSWNRPDHPEPGLLRILEGGTDFGKYDDPEYFKGPGLFNCGYGMQLKDYLEKNPGFGDIEAVLEAMRDAAHLWLFQLNNHDIVWYFGTLEERLSVETETGEKESIVRSMVFIREDQDPSVFLPTEWMGDEVLYPHRQDHHNRHNVDFGKGDREYHDWHRSVIRYQQSVKHIRKKAKTTYMYDVITSHTSNRVYAVSREHEGRRIISLANTGGGIFPVETGKLFPQGIPQGHVIRDNITGEPLFPGRGVLSEDAGHILLYTQRPLALEIVMISEEDDQALTVSEDLPEVQSDIPVPGTAAILGKIDPGSQGLFDIVSMVCSIVFGTEREREISKDVGEMPFGGPVAAGIRPKALILFADDIINGLGFFDIERTLSATDVHGKRFFQKNTFVLFGSKGSRAILSDIIQRADPSINLYEIEAGEIRFEDEVSRIKEVIKLSRRIASGESGIHPDFAGLIKGPTEQSLGIQRVVATDASLVPIVVFSGDPGIYSFRQAMLEAIQRSSDTDRARWFYILLPAVSLSGDIAEMYRRRILERREIDVRA